MAYNKESNLGGNLGKMAKNFMKITKSTFFVPKKWKDM